MNPRTVTWTDPVIKNLCPLTPPYPTESNRPASSYNAAWKFFEEKVDPVCWRSLVQIPLGWRSSLVSIFDPGKKILKKVPGGVRVLTNSLFFSHILYFLVSMTLKPPYPTGLPLLHYTAWNFFEKKWTKSSNMAGYTPPISNGSVV